MNERKKEEAQKKLATNFAEFVFWVLNAPNKMTSNSTTTTTTTTINAKDHKAINWGGLWHGLNNNNTTKTKTKIW